MKNFFEKKNKQTQTNSTYPILQKSCWKQKSKEEREKKFNISKKI